MRMQILSTLFFAMGALALFPAAHAAECRFERTLGVGAQGSLNATTGSGDLRVVPGDNTHVHIAAVVKSNGGSGWFGGGDSSADVQRICNQPPIEQAGSDVRIGQTHTDWLQHVSVSYVIEVPRSFNVLANSGSGNVELRDLHGAVTGTTGSGDVHATNLGAGAKLESGSGNIVAESMGGSARLGTGSGDIHAGFSAAGEVRATTGSGQIRLDNVRGGLTAHTGSGDVEASGKPSSTWQIDTGSGGIMLHLPQGTGIVLDAEASSGDIQSSLPMTQQGDLGKHHVRGAIAGGGPEVRVETNSGNIRVD